MSSRPRRSAGLGGDRLAHRLAVLDVGRVIAGDTPSELKARLGSTVIEIGMASEADALSAQPVLAAFASGDPEREGATLRVASRDGSGLIMELLRSLDAEGLAPTTVFVREPSLDDVFLSPDPPMFRLSCSTRADTAVGSADGAVARPVGHGPGDDMA